MTYQPPSEPYSPPTPYSPVTSGFIATAPPPKSRLPWILGGAAVLVVAALAAVVLVVGLPGGGISKSTAERECRTAVGREWQTRAAGAGDLATTIVPSVQNIEMQETYEIEGGYGVNATVHYSLTTGFIAPVQGTIDLTCEATGTDDAPKTLVTNR